MQHQSKAEEDHVISPLGFWDEVTVPFHSGTVAEGELHARERAGTARSLVITKNFTGKTQHAE